MRNDMQSNVTRIAENEFLDKCDNEPTDAELHEYDRMISIGTFGFVGGFGLVMWMVGASALGIAIGCGIAAGAFTYFARWIEQTS